MEKHEVIFLGVVHGEYKDKFGNVILGDCKSCRIFLHGNDNYFDFKGADISNSEIHIGNHCTLLLGDGTKFIYNNVYLAAGWNIVLEVGSDAEVSFGTINMFANSKLVIGEGTTIWYKYDFGIATNSECVIGKDCMFSSYVKINTGDAHSIFDTLSGQNINSNKNNCFHKVILENHVWCGMDCMILGDCYIGKGSIVGAKSLAKGIIPNNSIIAGVPGRVVAKNRAWAREYMAQEINKCGSDYIGLTEES